MVTFYRFHVAVTDLRLSKEHLSRAYAFSAIAGICGAIPSLHQRKLIRGIVIGIICGWAAALGFMEWGVGVNVTWIISGS